jgi:hypothetical protein
MGTIILSILPRGRMPTIMVPLHVKYVHAVLGVSENCVNGIMRGMLDGSEILRLRGGMIPIPRPATHTQPSTSIRYLDSDYYFWEKHVVAVLARSGLT